MNLPQTIESREVAKMVDKQHKELLRDIRNYVSVLTSANLRSPDYFVPSEYIDAKKEVRPCYEITKLGCELVGNKLTGKKGITFTAMYVARFNEMEQRVLGYSNNQNYNVPATFADALRLAADLEESNNQLKTRIAIDEPYSNFGKAVSVSTGAINVGEFCKIIYQEHGINIGRNKMFHWLRLRGYLIRYGREKNNPKQQYIEQGLFVSKPTLIIRSASHEQGSTTLITGKGQIKITNELLKEYLQIA